MGIENPDEKREAAEQRSEKGIESQIEQASHDVEASVAVLNENIARLPEPETVSVDEHPGLREKLEKYKTSILRNRDNFMTGFGLTATAMSPIAGLMFEAAHPDLNGFVAMGEVATISLLFVAADQIVGRINAYLKTKKYEKEILAGETN
jgi:hypothetical protein